MAANPALVQLQHGELVPAPFPQEVFLLKRPGVQLELTGVRTSSGRWNARGNVFLSNIRAVFVADKADPSGLAAFDLPLVYIRNDKLNQPIFGCNNLAGQVWPATDNGGPNGNESPHDFKILFKEGGIGTFFPLYYTLAERAKQAYAQAQQARDPNPPSFAESLKATAFVDPNDPTTIYLAQPVDASQSLAERPAYAANYGADEKYEPM